VLLLRVTSMSKGINFTPFLPAESTLQPEGLLHTRGMAASGSLSIAVDIGTSRPTIRQLSQPSPWRMHSRQLLKRAVKDRWPTIRRLGLRSLATHYHKSNSKLGEKAARLMRPIADDPSAHRRQLWLQTTY